MRRYPEASSLNYGPILGSSSAGHATTPHLSNRLDLLPLKLSGLPPQRDCLRRQRQLHLPLRSVSPDAARLARSSSSPCCSRAPVLPILGVLLAWPFAFLQSSRVVSRHLPLAVSLVSL